MSSLPRQRKSLPRFKVVITHTGKDDLQQIEASSRLKLLQKLKILETSPFPTIKPIKKIKLSHKIPLFRLRCGDYRVIYHIRDATVYIFAVIHRKKFDNAVKAVVKLLTERMRNGTYLSIED